MRVRISSHSFASADRMPAAQSSARAIYYPPVYAPRDTEIDCKSMIIYRLAYNIYFLSDRDYNDMTRVLQRRSCAELKTTRPSFQQHPWFVDPGPTYQ
jgi:uncharacterized protein YqkB